MKEWTDEMTAENRRRNRALSRGCRRPQPRRAMTDEERLNEDFEFWAERCARIKDKQSGRRVPFVLNRAQRKVLGEMERQRKARRPIRLIVLKSRQWGCSTLVCHYLMWLQTRRHENWHALICAHIKPAAAVLSGQMHDIVKYGPDDAPPVSIKRYMGLQSVSELEPSGSRLTVCTARNPDGARGSDFMMAHLSEVAYWPASGAHEASELVRSVCSAVPRVAESLVIMESTANGPGNYFHKEWQRAVAGESDKTAVFATWHEVEYNREKLILSPRETWERLTDYERRLWEPPLNLSLEQIFWYHNQTRAQGGRMAMMREHPTTPDEAFSPAAQAVFDPADLERLRGGIAAAERYEVDTDGHRLIESPSGRLEVWAHPCGKDELRVRPGYLIAVDVGGNWEGADWSVVAVFDVRTTGRLELAAQWRGHVDIDRLCDIATALGHIYHRALLIFESNTLESRGTHALEKLGRSGYPNLYRRRAYDSVLNTMSTRIGFHTNASSKASAIFELIYAIRDGILIERSEAAIGEMATYIRRGDKTEASHGCHDDIVMTRAIAAYALSQSPPRSIKPFH